MKEGEPTAPRVYVHLDPLITPVAFAFMKSGVYITKTESKVVDHDPHSLYVL